MRRRIIFVIFCFVAIVLSSTAPENQSTTETAFSSTTPESESTSENNQSSVSSTTKSTTTLSSINVTSAVNAETKGSRGIFEKCFKLKNSGYDDNIYRCILELKDEHKHVWGNSVGDAAFMNEIMELKDPRRPYSTPGISAFWVIIMAVILAMIYLIGNGIALFIFFRWNFKPLSRRPTDDELDDVLDADLPVMLIEPEKRATDFQFGAKTIKDTQTIMAGDQQQQQQQTEQQQSSMPDELKSGPADNPNGGNPPAAPIHQAPPQRRRGGGGAGKRRGGGGRGRGKK